MTGKARDSARTLELVIRAAVAEERLLGRRLARVEEEQRRTRARVDSAWRRDHFGQPLNGRAQPSSDR